MEYPKFKYIKNVERFLNTSEEGVECDCCGKVAHLFADTMYSKEDISVICVDCIKSGEACEKFDGEFNIAIKIDNAEAMDELLHKTPPLPSFQEFDWPACCNDFCTYLSVCKNEDLQNEKILADLKETFDEEYISYEEMLDMMPEYLLLFKCEKCGKHHVIVDVD